jgi:cyclophilin family peptidyl-prolyl cis-trans isomerase
LRWRAGLDQPAFGDSCGTCTTDGDCTSFGAGARCEANWCAVSQLDASESGSEDGSEIPNDGETGMGDELACAVAEPVVVIDTNYGDMTFQLDRQARTATDMFLTHVLTDFYDETIVHRVVDGLLLQSGAYGKGPALRAGAQAQAIGSLPPLSHDDGVLALVVTDQTISAQWYVTDGAQPELDGTGAVFGRLIDGSDVRDAISAAEVGTLAWMGFQLLDFPTDEIIVNDVYCVAP